MIASGSPVRQPDTTVVVVTWRAAQFLAECLDSLRRQTEAHDVLVVDNASTDGTQDVLRRYPEARVVRTSSNLGFAGGMARAQTLVPTDYIAMLNDDAVADPFWLERSLDVLRRRPAAAAVTARMILWTPAPAGPADPSAATAAVLNNAGVLLLANGYGADRGLGAVDGPPYDRAAEVFGFSGGAAVLRTGALRAAGGFESRFFLYYEDTDLSWRLRLQGYEIWYEPAAVVRHRHGASSAPGSPAFVMYTERNRLLMLLRCAPAGFAAYQVVRFAVTTASLAARRAIGRPAPPRAVFDPGLRLRVLRAVAVRLLWTWRTRRAIGRGIGPSRRSVRRARRLVAGQWLGRQALPSADIETGRRPAQN